MSEKIEQILIEFGHHIGQEVILVEDAAEFTRQILSAIVRAAEEGMPIMTMDWRNELWEEWGVGRGDARGAGKPIPKHLDVGFDEYLWGAMRQACIDYLKALAEGKERNISGSTD